MKSLVCSLMVCCFTAVSASAGGSGEVLRRRIILCDQFVIEHPYPGRFYPGRFVHLTGFVSSPDRVDRITDCHFGAQHPL